MHVICPLEFERSRLARAAHARSWTLHCSGPGGVGIDRWAAATALPPGTTVILAGVAGGLRPSATPGTAVSVASIVDEHGARWRPSHGGSSHHRSVRCLGIERMLQTPFEKHAAAERFDADIVDMESATFARVAEAAGWNWAVVRGISDGCNDALPAGVEHWTADNGRTRVGMVLGSLARRPTLLPQVMALARRSGAAMRAVETLLLERDWSKRVAAESDSMRGSP
ncbi:MAG: hypothetical protein DWH86_02430 [Planctomycetota bacterium]|nr:MAG: hypothetical protein DWH86_02430 [Planctomycetota bacterium]